MMRKDFILVGVFVLVVFGGGGAYARDDWQFWHNYEVTTEMTDKLSLKLTGEQRLTGDFSDSTLANVSPGFLWYPSEHFEIGPFFKYEREKERKGEHINERRWLIEGTLKFKLGPLKFSDRNRMAYRERSNSDEWRYRNRLKLSYPVTLRKLLLEPFASEEIFWQWNDGSLNQNRVQMGMTWGVNTHLSVSLYYMIKSNRKGSDWDHAHILGTGLGLHF